MSQIFATELTSLGTTLAFAFRCLTLYDPMDYIPPGSFVQGIFQARILEWVSISFSKRSSRPRDWTHVSWVSFIDGWIFFTTEPSGKPWNCPTLDHFLCEINKFPSKSFLDGLIFYMYYKPTFNYSLNIWHDFIQHIFIINKWIWYM